MMPEYSMKIISLNIWGGKVYEPLFDFITHYNSEIDVFCFQEMYKGGQSFRPHLKNMHMNIFVDIQNILKDYQGFFSETQTHEEGLGLFVKDSIKIESFQERFVFRSRNAMVNLDARTLGRLIQIVKFSQDNKDFSIINFHGLWNGMGKTDTSERLKQSNNIKKSLNKLTGNKILCGDFNLLPNTESLSIIKNDMRNLITEYKITSTRSGLYKKHERFADYILVSENVKVKDFKVLQDEVSDHLPLYLEFS